MNTLKIENCINNSFIKVHGNHWWKNNILYYCLSLTPLKYINIASFCVEARVKRKSLEMLSGDFWLCLTNSKYVCVYVLPSISVTNYNNRLLRVRTYTHGILNFSNDSLTHIVLNLSSKINDNNSWQTKKKEILKK